jgi:hypothetical protein
MVWKPESHALNPTFYSAITAPRRGGNLPVPNPVLYTLYPIPYTLHPTPYTLYYSLYPIP